MMAIDDIFIGFTISYLAGLTPSLKGLKEGGKSLQDLIDNCYEKALKRWSADNVIRKRIAQYKFSSVEQLRELYNTNKWTDDAQSLKELADLWADELRKDEVCAHYIQEKGILEINDKIDKLINLLTASDRYNNPRNQYRGLKTHKAVDGYIRRYCSSEKSESNFINYLLCNKERHILADYVVENVASSTNKFILYSSAQTGKTTELKQLCWELQESGLYIPILLEVRDNSDLKREHLPFEQYENGKEIVVVIDALDEVNGKTQEDILETIDGYATEHPEIKMVLSCRSNYRSDSRLHLFTELFLEDLDREDIQNEINRKLGNSNRLFKNIAELQLFDFAKNPFYLKVLIESKRLPKTKADIYRLFIDNCYKEKDCVSKDDFDKYVHLLERIALVVSLMNTQSLSKDELYKCAVNENDIEQCLRFDLIQCENFRYSFKQSAIREWLVADYLYRVGIEKAKQLATHPNNQIKKEWYNIIVLWLSMYGNDNKKETSTILQWLKEVGLELVINIDRNMVDDAIRHDIFKAILQKYKDLGIRFSNLTTNDYKNLLSFDQSEDTVYFITNEIQESAIDTSYYADLMCLCFFLDWDNLCQQSQTRLFDVLVQKVKEELVKENTSTLTFLFFDNCFFRQTYYLEQLFEIVKTSNYYEAISSMIKLIDKANKVEKHLDYILEKEAYVHDQQDGNTTLSVSRRPIYNALSNVNSLDGIKKVLVHQFKLPYYSLEQKEYLKMMGCILNRVKSFINTENNDITNYIIDNLYSNIFINYDYQFDRGGVRQELIKMLRDCFSGTDLRTNGRNSFDELISSIAKNEIDKDLANKTFFVAALWMTKEDVKRDFDYFAPDNQLDQCKAHLYTEIPSQEIAEYAYSLYNDKYYQNLLLFKLEEKQQKDFNDFAEYETFKQIVLNVISELDNNITRKKLWGLIEIYNQFAVKFIQQYVDNEEDNCDLTNLEHSINNRDNYEAFFAKTVSEMILTSHLNHFVTTDAKERCKSYAKECIFKVCNGEDPTTYFENALKLLLNKYFELEIDDLVQLLDYGYFHIAIKDKDDYYARDFYLFDYISARVDPDNLIDIIIDKLRANLDKGYSLLSHLYSKYLIENNIAEGYSLALKYALSNDDDILAIIIKENIKISEIKDAIKRMEISKKLLCYSLFVENNVDNEWARQLLESEFQILEGYELKRAIKLLLRLGSLDALQYLGTHPECIISDDYVFNYNDSKAIPYLCNILKLIVGNQKNDKPFVLQSILTSLEKIAINKIDYFSELQSRLKQMTEVGDQFKFLNRFTSSLEEKYYASNSGTKDIENVIFLIDSNPEYYVYISYKWEDNSSLIVNYLCCVLEMNGIPYKRDTKDCKYTDNIKDFMDEIRTAKSVIVVFSKEYLYSLYCMYELSGIIQDSNFKKRILPIRIDREIKDDHYYVTLVDHWNKEKEKQEKIVNDLIEIDQNKADTEKQKLKDITLIYNLLETIKNYIDNTNTGNINEMSENRFESIISKIREKMNS